MRGSHGTCRSFAESIQKHGGFDPSKHGRIGKGTYFWLHANSETGRRLGGSLARIWFLQASEFEDGPYEKAENKDCAIIFVSLDLDEECYLDFDDAEVSTDYDAFFLEGKNRFGSLSEPEQSRIRDVFVQLLEGQLGCRYDAVLGLVDVPRGNFTIGEIASDKRRSKCAAVRNQKVVKIDAIEYSL